MLLLCAASAQAATTGTLKPGESGPSVTALQRMLLMTGLTVDVDGTYGASTGAAVRAFQQAANIGANGVADHTTRHRLTLATRASAATASADANTGGVSVGAAPPAHHLGDRIPVAEGMHGNDVRALQKLLTKAGIKSSSDGVFGAGTAHAVRSFQHKVGLEMTGVVNAGVIDALRGDTDAPGTGTVSDLPTPLSPADTATIGPDGLAIAPASAPVEVQQIIAAGNHIAKLPYRYGGGHGSFHDSAYDCSGSVSYALHGGGLLDTTMDSTRFETWGDAGAGTWITVYANAGHAYMVVAGLRFDTSGAHPDRWQTDMRSSSGYTVRHPTGF